MFKGIGLNSACFREYDAKTAFSGVASAGFHLVELASMKGWCEHISPDMNQAEKKNVKLLLKEYGLTPIAIAAHIDFLASDDAFLHLSSNIDLAAEFGCDIVITSPGEGDNGERIEKLVMLDNKCIEYGIKLALEPHGSLYSGELLQELIISANTKNVFINYDTANVLFFGGLEPVPDMKKSLRNIGHVHLKDKRGGKGVWDFPALGEGKLPMDCILSTLKNGEYQGYLTIEIEFTPNGPENYEEIYRSAKVSFEHITTLLDKLNWR